MRAILLLVALSAITASAESPLAGAETPPRTCADCLVLSPSDVEQLKADFMEAARKAYRAGQADVQARCASLV